MLEINLNTAEKLLFNNPQVRTLLPEHAYLFDQWRLSRLLPSMRPDSKRVVLRLVEAITDSQINRLETHFKMPVTINRQVNRLVQNHEFATGEAELELNELDLFQHICISRNTNTVYISSWR